MEHDASENLLTATTMPSSDHMFLSPIQKWKRYHKFPFKLVLHVILLICTLTPYVFNQDSLESYSADLNAWSFAELLESKMSLKYYSVSKTLLKISEVHRVYDTFANDSLCDTSVRQSIRYSIDGNEYYTPTNENINLKTLDSLRMLLVVDNKSIILEFKRISRYAIELRQIPRRESSSSPSTTYSKSVIVLLASVYLVLCIRSIGRSISLLRIATKQVPEMKLSLRLEFIQFRYMLTAIGLCSLILFKAFYNTSTLLNALGTFLLWTTSIGFLEKSPRFYALILTIKSGFPRVFYFIVGTSPVFIAYALAGNIIFNSSGCFSSVNNSFKTLFAVMNGDEILDTFDEVSYNDNVGQIYLYSFITLFMYVFLNVFIAIVEEAFFFTASAKRLLRERDEDDNVQELKRVLSIF